jgi:hypothetical protein
MVQVVAAPVKVVSHTLEVVAAVVDLGQPLVRVAQE